MNRFVAALMLSLGACSGEPPAPQPEDKKPAAIAAEAAPSSQPALVPAKERLVKEQSDLVEFAYGWPAEAAAIPKLVAHLEVDVAKQRGEAIEMAKEDKASRPADADFNGHFFSKVWKTYGSGQRLLSLGGAIETFTGGAHGNSAWETLLWDRKRNAQIPVADIFIDPGRAFELIRPVYCQGLDKERAERRQEELPLKGDDFMVDCPPLAEQPLVLIDRDDRKFESLLVLLAPYTAGPYAEGSYEVEIELTDAMRRLIKPEYAGDF